MRISDWSSDVCSSDLFELSGAPLKTIHDTCAEVHTHLDQIREVAGPLGVPAMGLGFQPKWTREDIPRMPKIGRAHVRTQDLMRSSYAVFCSTKHKSLKHISFAVVILKQQQITT